MFNVTGHWPTSVIFKSNLFSFIHTNSTVLKANVPYHNLTWYCCHLPSSHIVVIRLDSTGLMQQSADSCRRKNCSFSLELFYFFPYIFTTLLQVGFSCNDRTLNGCSFYNQKNEPIHVTFTYIHICMCICILQHTYDPKLWSANLYNFIHKILNIFLKKIICNYCKSHEFYILFWENMHNM